MTIAPIVKATSREIRIEVIKSFDKLFDRVILELEVDKCLLDARVGSYQSEDRGDQ